MLSQDIKIYRPQEGKHLQNRASHEKLFFLLSIHAHTVIKSQAQSKDAGDGHTQGRCQQQTLGGSHASGAPVLPWTSAHSATWLQLPAQRQQLTAVPPCCHATPLSPHLQASNTLFSLACGNTMVKTSVTAMGRLKPLLKYWAELSTVQGQQLKVSAHS